MVRMVLHHVVLYSTSLRGPFGPASTKTFGMWVSFVPLFYFEYDGFLPGNLDTLPGRVT
jgi:hypothetical protein